MIGLEAQTEHAESWYGGSEIWRLSDNRSPTWACKVQMMCWSRTASCLCSNP